MGKPNVAPTCRSDKPTKRSNLPEKGLRPELADVLEPGPVKWKKAVPRGNTDLPQAGSPGQLEATATC